MASVNTDSQWSKQETCFTHATQVLLVVNHNSSVISNKKVTSDFRGTVSINPVKVSQQK